jgi:hypothetical protein
MPRHQVAAAAPRDPAQAFLAQNAAFQRRAAGPAPAAAVSNRVVPLELTGGTLPLLRPAAAVHPAAAPVAGKDAAAEGLPANPPVDVSRKMLDALDKYMKMQQAPDAKGGARQVDLVQ